MVVLTFSSHAMSGSSDERETTSSVPTFGSSSNFLASIMVLGTMGVAVWVVNFLSRLSTFVGGVLAIPVGALIHHWYWLHGGKLTRKEMIFFDEANLLETSNLFEYNRAPNTEGTTPISGPEKNPDAPTNLWQALFCDDRELQIQKFYKEHYGPVWETAKRREQEWKAIHSTAPNKASPKKNEEPSKK